ncbi:MAG: aminotransferase class IV, partial [Spirochaetaceae bacterium]|nr:aminotransferase class IV [Spirochaetaceae bacterium]
TNIILELDGALWTPPVSCGLLNGIMRQRLLAEGFCKERILTKAGVCAASRILAVNSVRGIKEVKLAAN